MNMSKELKDWSGDRSGAVLCGPCTVPEIMHRSTAISKNLIHLKNRSWVRSGELFQEIQNPSRNHPTNSYAVTKTVPGIFLENQSLEHSSS